MQELEAGIRELHERVASLDTLLREDRETRDLHEKLGAATASQAEEAVDLARMVQAFVRKVFIIVTVAMLTWTPFIGYGSVWVHEKMRNNCYPGNQLTEPGSPSRDPWYCTLFPGTDRYRGH